MLANPFAGVKVKGHAPRSGLDVSRGFSEGEWLLIRTLADGLEWSYGWSVPAAQRVRFLLDFGYATGLRAGELVGATLADIRRDEHGDHWRHVLGKGGKRGKVALPTRSRTSGPRRPRSCAARVRTGCGTRTPRTRWRGAPS